MSLLAGGGSMNGGDAEEDEAAAAAAAAAACTSPVGEAVPADTAVTVLLSANMSPTSDSQSQNTVVNKNKLKA
jgi:hypothetical protein